MIIKQPFLAGAVATTLFALFAPAVFAAPDATVPVVTVPKPGKLTVKIKPRTARTIVKLRRADRAKPMGIKAVVIDEPNLQDGTISVVTEKNEFATIATGMGTRIARGYSQAALNNIHPGYSLRCQGAWDQDGFQYQASSIALGNSVKDTDVTARVNAACKNVGRARKGGGFGQSLVAMVPATALPQAVRVATDTGLKTVTPIPAGMVVPQPAPKPISPSTVPAQPGQLPAGTIPVIPPVIPALPANPVPVVPQVPVAPIP